MKGALAWMMAFALLNVISVCPVLAHQEPAAQSCCEHSHGQNLPCTGTSPNNCPYMLLEKSLAKHGLAVLFTAPVASAQVEANRPTIWLTSPSGVDWAADSSGSYLLFRVLLI